ncbi:MAG: TonB-dependent siderophore receptor, partial [Pseudomonadota bacterium]|nr:TonB-dependent siderophore receptor [Pseudomonadota bacterium]
SHAALTVNYVGERLGDTVDPDYILPEHWLVDVSAGVEVLPDLTVEAAITNLTDTFWVDNSYSALWTQPGAPRTYKASLTYEF